jgi:hypothetical protein
VAAVVSPPPTADAVAFTVLPQAPVACLAVMVKPPDAAVPAMASDRVQVIVRPPVPYWLHAQPPSLATCTMV